MGSTLRTALAEALTVALRHGDRPKVAAVRIALAAVANAEAVDASDAGSEERFAPSEVERRQLTESDVESIVRQVRDDMRASSSELRRLGQHERAEELARQADAMSGFIVG
jgi:uncharacterized protein YqeY